MPSTSPTLLDLPDELLAHVVHLVLENGGRLAATVAGLRSSCARLRRITDIAKGIKLRVGARMKSWGDVREILMRWGPRVTILSTDQTRAQPSQDELHELATLCPNLAVLKVSLGMHFATATSVTLAHPVLRRLHLRVEAILGTHALPHLSLRLPQLVHLDVYGPLWARLDVSRLLEAMRALPSLRSVGATLETRLASGPASDVCAFLAASPLTAVLLPRACEHGPLLAGLAGRPVPWTALSLASAAVSAEAFEALLRAAGGGLEALALPACASDDFLGAVVRHAPRLRRLNARPAWQLSAAALGKTLLSLPLRSLVLRRPPDAPEAAGPFGVPLGAVERLRAAGAAVRGAGEWHVWPLQRLDLIAPEAWEPAAVPRLARSLPALRRLRLARLEASDGDLEAFGAHCPQLERIELVGGAGAALTPASAAAALERGARAAGRAPAWPSPSVVFDEHLKMKG